MDYLAKSEACVDPQSRRIVCTLRQMPPDVGRVKIDNIYYPYKLRKWDGKLRVATLHVNAAPDKLAYRDKPSIMYLTLILIVGQYKKRKT